MRIRILKPGDPCPFCGQPLRQTDPEALRLLAVLADIIGLPESGEDSQTDIRDVSRPEDASNG